eukprot:s995_g26.t1
MAAAAKLENEACLAKVSSPPEVGPGKYVHRVYTCSFPTRLTANSIPRAVAANESSRMALRENAMRQQFWDVVKEIGTTERACDWDATHKDWRAKLFRSCKTIDVLDQNFEEEHMVALLEFLVGSSTKSTIQPQVVQCLRLLMQTSPWKKVAESKQELQASIVELVSPPNSPAKTDDMDEALGQGLQTADPPPDFKEPEGMDDNRTSGACSRYSRLCGRLCCCCKVARLASTCAALVLLVAALAFSGPGIMVLMEVPIHCGHNPVCYYKIYKNVIMACAEAHFPPSPQCMQRQFFHTVPITGFSEENIISVCGLNIFNSCFKDRCPHARDTSCWLWGPEDPGWDADSVGEDKRPLASVFPKIFLNITRGLYEIAVSDMKVKLEKHEEADYILRKLYEMKNPNASKIHKDAFISEQVHTMDSDKDNTVTETEYKNYVLHLIQKYPNLFSQRQRIVLMGNPGRGKSTLLNALAGTVLFKAGQAKDGEGVTRNMSVKDTPHRVPGRGYWTLVDTPGLADESLRKVAAAEIRKALRSDTDDAGELIPHRMIFVITLLGGRVSEEDKVTMKVILRAAREITSFGIIVNQKPAGLQMDHESQKQIEARILVGLTNDKTRAYLHWFPEISEARFAENAVIAGEPVEELWNWTNSIDPVHVRDVDALELADMKELLAEVQAELQALKQSREEQSKVIEKMEKDRQEAEERAAERAARDAQKIREQQERLAKLEAEMKERAAEKRQQQQKITTLDESARRK